MVEIKISCNIKFLLEFLFLLKKVFKKFSNGYILLLGGLRTTLSKVFIPFSISLQINTKIISDFKFKIAMNMF